MMKLSKVMTSTVEPGIKYTDVNVLIEPGVVKPPKEALKPSEHVKHMTKRGIDIIFSSIMILMSLPLLTVISALVLLSSMGPVLFKQERVGFKEILFRIFKFRTMRPDTSQADHQEYIKKLLHDGEDPEKRPELMEAFVHHIDNRITGIGRLLRATSLDELPQLFNILKGEMSVVGPRPHPTYEVQEYKTWYKRRLDVKPGLTGWSKINLRNTTVNYEEAILYDLWYVDHWTIPLDIRIILLTVPFVLSRQDAR